MRKPFLRLILLLMPLVGVILFGEQVSATITSLPMSNPFCSQPDPSVNQCLINIRYWQANDNGLGNILAYVNFSIDGKLRYRSNAFFENFVTYSFDMIPGGIKVACGLPNEGGFGPEMLFLMGWRSWKISNENQAMLDRKVSLFS